MPEYTVIALFLINFCISDCLHCATKKYDPKVTLNKPSVLDGIWAADSESELCFALSRQDFKLFAFFNFFKISKIRRIGTYQVFERTHISANALVLLILLCTYLYVSYRF